MTNDRITQLRVQGLRSIERAVVDLSGVTVLIGDNGAGKSTLLEALELLHLAAGPGKFATDIIGRKQGGLRALLRRGASMIHLGVRVECEGRPSLDYDVAVSAVGNHAEIAGEAMWIWSAAEPRHHALHRDGLSGQVRATGLDESMPEHPLQNMAAQLLNPFPGGLLEESALVLPAMAVARPFSSFSRVVNALRAIDLHAPFETRSLWQQAELDTRQGPRRDIELVETDRLERYGVNLPNAYYQLRSVGGAVWDRVLSRARLGLGEDLTDLRQPAFGRGRIELSAVFSGLAGLAVPAESLSDGQIAYLAFIALCELNPSRSLLAFDEPELHLHPALLTRVLFMLEEVAQRHPVILSTHSDRLLDALSDPAKQVVLCELDENRATRLVRPNAARLASWMQDYRGLGSIRAEGYEPHVFDQTPDAEPSEETR